MSFGMHFYKKSMNILMDDNMSYFYIVCDSLQYNQKNKSVDRYFYILLRKKSYLLEHRELLSHKK